MEHSTSAVNWQPVNPAKAPGQTHPRQPRPRRPRRRRHRLLPVAASRAPGAEKFHSALVPHAGTRQRALPRGRASSAPSRSGSASCVGTTVEAEVAILWDYQAAWAASGPAMPSLGARLRADGATPSTALLRDRGVTADVVHPDADLTAYRLVVVPTLYLVTDAHAAAIAAAAEAGAQVLVTYFSGISDEHDHVRLGGYPGAFRDLLGVRVEEFFPLRAGETVRPVRRRHRPPCGARTSRAVGAEVAERPTPTGPLAGRPAVTRRAVGDGCRVVPQHPARRRRPRRAARPASPRPPASRPAADVPRRRRGGPAQRRPTARGSSSLNHTDASSDVDVDRPRPGGRPADRPDGTARRRWRRRGPGGLSVLASQRRATILDLVEEQRRRAGLRPRRAARRLGHDGPPRHRAAGPPRACVERVHGGALALGGRSTEEPGFTAKSALSTPQKHGHRPGRGRSSSSRAPPIGISAGTTTYELARAVRDVPDLTVVTNSVPVAAAAARVGHARPDRRPDRRRAHAVRRARRPGRRRGPAHAARRPAVPRRARHRRARRASPPPTSSRPRPTGPSSTRPAGSCVLADHTKWGIVGLSTIVDAVRGRPARHRRRASARGPAAPLTDAGGELVLATAAASRTAAPRGARHDACGAPAAGWPTAARSSTSTTPPGRRPSATAEDTRDRSASGPPPGEMRHDAARRRLGRRRRPPAAPHLPAARRTSARCAPPGAGSVPSEVPEATTTSSSSRTASRSYRPSPTPSGRGAGDGTATCPARAGARPVRGRLLHQRPRRRRSPTSPPSGPAPSSTPGPTAPRSWARCPEVEQVFCFENRGQEIGVTLHHPHGQIYAYPYRAAAHRRPCWRRPPSTTTAPVASSGADILAAELRPTASGSSSTASTGRPTCPSPRAGRSRCTSPRTATCPTSPRSTDDERDELAQVYLDLLRRLDRYYVAEDGAPVRLPYIAGWHQAPGDEGRDVLAPAPAGHVGAARARQAQVPRRLRVRASAAGSTTSPPSSIAARLREVAP